MRNVILICFERRKTNVKKNPQTHLIDWILCCDQGKEKAICHKNDYLYLLIHLMYFLSIYYVLCTIPGAAVPL